MHRLQLLIGLTLLILLCACGKKGPVRPLQEKVPQAVEAAKILQRGESFQLQWKMPKHNQDGSSLNDLDEILVERIFSTEDEFCSECTTPWPLIARIHPQLPKPAQQVRNLYLLSDSGALKGQVGRYRLSARNKEGALGLALILKQSYRQPVSPPSDVRIIPHDQSLELNWKPTETLEGAVLVGYQIYRRSGTEPFAPLSTNLRPIKETRFADFGLTNGRTYYYRVRSLFKFGEERLESLPSIPVSATPAAG
ncbi:fibronectin type III domain-containing protein [Geopsychrobacter electrodiphilus]|uniref:fibronectin type III domain-containing protein n=1 Tax=Geopsychrobacter electrodiphilus TaxID=225196 RepID=UPI0003657C7D|nr:fibronectin type III domain-containing protein [Geopsychrobacter electrodiphilus]